MNTIFSIEKKPLCFKKKVIVKLETEKQDSNKNLFIITLPNDTNTMVPTSTGHFIR